jgi:2-hydroxychromene-2-carboxylate isomerase
MYNLIADLYQRNPEKASARYKVLDAKHAARHKAQCLKSIRYEQVNLLSNRAAWNIFYLYGKYGESTEVAYRKFRAMWANDVRMWNEMALYLPDGELTYVKKAS